MKKYTLLHIPSGRIWNSSYFIKSNLEGVLNSYIFQHIEYVENNYFRIFHFSSITSISNRFIKIIPEEFEIIEIEK